MKFIDRFLAWFQPVKPPVKKQPLIVEQGFTKLDLIIPKDNQRSSEWIQERIGKIGASSSDYLRQGKYNQLATVIYHKDQVIVNEAMDYGREMEGPAKERLKAVLPLDYRDCGFIKAPFDPLVGCSPDSLIYEGKELVGGVEIKCPFRSSVFLKHRDVPNSWKERYWSQVQWSMFTTMLPYWYFVSFDPRISNGSQLFIEKVDRCEETMKEFRYHLKKFKDYKAKLEKAGYKTM